MRKNNIRRVPRIILRRRTKAKIDVHFYVSREHVYMRHCIRTANLTEFSQLSERENKREFCTVTSSGVG